MANPFIRILTLLVCLAGVALLHTAAYGAAPVKIGILALRPKPQAMVQWQPLAAALKQAMPAQDFAVEVFTDDELSAAVASRQLDFVLTNPGHYVLLLRRHGLSAPLATLIDYENGQATSAFGGVIFSRAKQSNINTLRDIRGKTVATIGEGYLAGYQMQAYELKQAGIDLQQDVRLVKPGKSMDDVVEAVLDGRADAGFVRSGLLEHMAQDGRLDMKRLKIINCQKLPGFPVEVSTRLYPEWIFAALPHADDHIVRHVVATLLRLEENPAATRAMGIYGFAVPTDYAPVSDMLREMRFPPFEAVPQFTFKDVWKRYYWQMLGALLAMGLITILGLRLLIMRRQLKMQYQASLRSETRLRTLYESTVDAVMLLDEKSFFDCNDATLRTFGCASKEEFCSKHPADLSPPMQPDGTDSMTLANRRIATAMETGSNLFEWVHKRADTGEIFPADVLLSRMELDGRMVLQATVRDITARKKEKYKFQQVRQAAQEAELRYRMVADFTYDWEGWIDLGGNWLYCSPSCLRITGYRADEFFADPQLLLKIAHPEERDAVRSSLEEAFTETGHGNTTSFRIEHKGGRIVWIEHASQPVFDDDGRCMGYRTSSRDITERKQAEEALLESEEKFHRLFEDAADPVLLLKDGKFVDCNAATLKLLGYESKEKLINVSPPDISPPCQPDGRTSVEKYAEMDAIALREGFNRFEWVHSRVDGSTVPVEVTLTSIIVKGNQILHVLWRDITERKLAEESFMKLLTAVEQSPVSIVITNLDGNIEYVNQTFINETGYSFLETIGQNPRILNSGKNSRETYQALWSCLMRGEVWKGELINRRKDGSEYTESALISPVRQVGGRTTHYLAVKNNISPRKQNEAQIGRLSRTYRLLSRANEAIVRASSREQLFSEICQAAVESELFRFIWVGMLDEQKLVVKPVACAGVEEGYMAKLNIRLDDVQTGNGPTGRAIRESIHVVCTDIESDPSMMPWRSEALKRGYRSSGVFPIYEGFGIVGVINAYAAEVFFFTPDIISLMLDLAADISFALDVFAEKQNRELAEEKIRQMNFDLEHRVMERTIQLESANKELASFSYAVSHDLRAPLRSIDGFSQILAKKYSEQLDATGRDYLQRVSRASQRMGHLIDDMLRLSQVARGEVKKELVDLSHMVEEIAGNMRGMQPERAVRFVVQPGLQVYADTGLLRILMDNLLGNAFKYTGKKSVAEIEFGMSDINGEHVFFVRDNGAGFNMEYAHKLFGPFQRLHGANEFEGTGIGLATVQRIIHKHHGKVWAEAIEGEGATVFFTLPQRARERGGMHE